jgi:hypothetical protein
VFENRALTKLSGPKWEVGTGRWRQLHNVDFIISIPHQTLSGCSNQRGQAGWGIWHVWGREGMNTGVGGETGRRSRRRWESIKLDLTETGWDSVD